MGIATSVVAFEVDVVGVTGSDGDAVLMRKLF